MDALKKEIEAESSKKSVDSRLCELMLKVLEEVERRPAASATPVTSARGPRGEPGPQGPAGSQGPRGEQGPAGVCQCKCTQEKKATTTTTRKKKATAPEVSE